MWYTYPIPDTLREFWFTERREIFDFMQKNYGHLDIEFLPNRILREMYQQQQIGKSLAENIINLKEFSTTLSCEISLQVANNFTHFPTINDFLY